MRSVPSTRGRALAALTPLSQAEPGTPVVVTTSGESVLNLACPLLRANEVSCSDGVRGRMAVRDPLPDSAALVVVQLDLTKPR